MFYCRFKQIFQVLNCLIKILLCYCYSQPSQQALLVRLALELLPQLTDHLPQVSPGWHHLWLTWWLPMQVAVRLTTLPVLYYGYDSTESLPTDMCLAGCIFYMGEYLKTDPCEQWIMVSLLSWWLSLLNNTI